MAAACSIRNFIPSFCCARGCQSFPDGCDRALDGVVDFDIVAKSSKEVMDVFLLGSWLVAWTLEFDQEGSAARDEEQAVGPSRVRSGRQLEANDTEVVPDLLDRPSLDVGLLDGPTVSHT
jgi:hypothetical protein